MTILLISADGLTELFNSTAVPKPASETPPPSYEEALYRYMYVPFLHRPHFILWCLKDCRIYSNQIEHNSYIVFLGFLNEWSVQLMISIFLV